mgnify:CR=1 FL=1|tara:strand:- start:485 stop:1336 length:852 start_codon:yes stop_codon:yes gene_type:complete
MNFITVSATAIDAPQTKEINRISYTTCNIKIAKPLFGKSYSDVFAYLEVWGKNASLLSGVSEGQEMLIINGELTINYDKERGVNIIKIKAKSVAPYFTGPGWTPINDVILTGRTFTEFDPTDPKQRNYRSTASGWVFAEQRLAVQNKGLDKYPDIYTFKTVYNTNAEYRGTNYADLIANLLNRKQVPVSIKGSLINEESKNPNTDEIRHYPKILLADKNALTVFELKSNPSQNVKPQEPKVQSTSKVIANNPWKDTEQLQSLAPDPTPIPAVATAPDTSEDPF